MGGKRGITLLRCVFFAAWALATAAAKAVPNTRVELAAAEVVAIVPPYSMRAQLRLSDDAVKHQQALPDLGNFSLRRHEHAQISDAEISHAEILPLIVPIICHAKHADMDGVGCLQNDMRGDTRSATEGQVMRGAVF